MAQVQDGTPLALASPSWRRSPSDLRCSARSSLPRAEASLWRARGQVARAQVARRRTAVSPEARRRAPEARWAPAPGQALEARQVAPVAKWEEARRRALEARAPEARSAPAASSERAESLALDPAAAWRLPFAIRATCRLPDPLPVPRTALVTESPSAARASGAAAIRRANRTSPPASPERSRSRIARRVPRGVSAIGKRTAEIT
jgi:hypothetical protein